MREVLILNALTQSMEWERDKNTREKNCKIQLAMELQTEERSYLQVISYTVAFM